MTWRRLTGAAAVWTALLMLGVGIALSDLEAVAIGLGVAVGAALLRVRRGLLGRLALLALFADVALWMVPAAVTNVAHGEDLVAVGVPVVLATAALLGLAAAAVSLATRNRATAGAGRVVAGTALVAVAAVAASQAGLFGDPVEQQRGDLVVAMRNVRFVPADLEGTDDNPVTVVVENDDLFWHTFTIEQLDVDVRVPVKGRRRVTMTAPPGDYEITCEIPGHTAVGMDGTLTVRSAS